jgi:meiotically up-regulated gene 157 (Mug157) protein
VLSKENPYYYEGTAAKGIGSPHTPENYIWHIALSMQGLTSTSVDECKELLHMLTTCDADTGFMHEGFHKDDPAQFTRPWFAWSNSLFSEFVLKCLDEGVL